MPGLRHFHFPDRENRSACLAYPTRARPYARQGGKAGDRRITCQSQNGGRFLGKGYTVRASVGHVRDLLRSELSVDVENDFTPKYRVPNEKRPVVKELK